MKFNLRKGSEHNSIMLQKERKIKFLVDCNLVEHFGWIPNTQW